MNNAPQTPFEDVVDQIMLEECAPDHAALVRWVKRYPEHRDALTRFFATWAGQEKSTEKVSVDEDLAGSRMVSKALNALHSEAIPSPACSQKPQRLCQAVRSRGLSEGEFASRCDLDDSLLAKLDLRRIDLTRVPRKLYRLLADALGQTIDDIRVLLTGDPVPAGANKAKRKPVITIEDFLDAVRMSDLPDEKKAAWVAAVEAENAEEGNP